MVVLLGGGVHKSTCAEYKFNTSYMVFKWGAVIAIELKGAKDAVDLLRGA